MPIVSVRYNPKISHGELKAIVPTLTTTLANQLTCKDNGQDIVITPAMVKIRFDVASELDTSMPDLHIEVEARAFEARKANLNAYCSELADALVPLIRQDVHMSIWYKLCQASWQARTVTAGSAPF